MNLTLSIRPRARWMAGFAGSSLALLAACGPGGGGGSALTIQSTIFGYDPFSGNFDAAGQQGEAPLIPLNMCVVFDFSEPLRGASATAQSIVVQELDTTVTPPAPGPLAAAEYIVSGNRLTICPLVTFTDTTAIYGWGDSSAIKTYQVLFQIPPSTPTLLSQGGRTLAAKDRGPYLFRTSTQIFDQKAGAPVPTMRLLDPDTGAALATTNVATSPVPNIEITFDEPVIPSTAVDPGGVGSSSNIHVELDTDGNVLTTGDRIIIPGTYTLTPSGTDAVVLFESFLKELPTDPTAGCVYVVTVDGTVQDLSGNSKVSVSSNPGANDVFTFTTAPGAATTPIDPIEELFDTQDQNDLTVTSAKWGTTFAGFLSPGIGGGTGVDGAFDPNNAGFQASPPSGITLSVPNKTVTMNTESLANPGTQRVYEFTSFRVPSGWTVGLTGAFPLSIQVSGNVNIIGTLNVSGAAGATMTGTVVAGGAGGAAKGGGAAGGRGGSPSDSAGTSNFFAGRGLVGKPTYPQLAFDTSAATNQGVTGRSTALDSTTFTLEDSAFAALLDALTLTDLWIQPNIGADDYRFERFHPAFKVESISGGVVTVVSDPTDANYRGELSQETDNDWLESDGSGGFRSPLLSELFDAYVIGDLAGIAGGQLFDLDLDGGVDDVVAQATAGTGSDPQSVMQSFLTLARSGGGGGGGGITAGEAGDDDPTVANGAGAFGGTGTTGGAGGTAYPTATLLSRVDSDTLTLTTDLFDDGTGNPDPTFEGHLINPNVAQGNVFVILSVDDVDQVTILPITTSSGATIDLSTTTMAPGSTVRVTPPYTAGGTGGGGAGMHCAGSSKTPFNHTGHPDLNDARNQNGASTTTDFYDDDGGIAPPNQVQDGLEDGSESIFALPRWIPGGGGGAGGSSVVIVAAGNIDIGAAGQILADGGAGGRSDLAGTTAASGGGGGAGGTIVLGAGGTLAAALGGRISAIGGAGGAAGFGIEGGAGGDGRIRLENAAGTLSALNFVGVGTPTIAAEHLGRFPGGGSSVAQSSFLPSGALSPDYQQIIVNYTVKENGTTISASYVVNADGTIDTGASNPDAAPFDLQVSVADPDPATGLVDDTTATAFADPTVTPMSSYAGRQFLRFKFVLGDAVTPVVIGGDSYTDVRIDSIELRVNSVKP